MAARNLTQRIKCSFTLSKMYDCLINQVRFLVALPRPLSSVPTFSEHRGTSSSTTSNPATHLATERHCVCARQTSGRYPLKYSKRVYSSVSVTKGEVFYPRRAVMYVPASDEHKTKKAATLSVDTIVFDLEDGVAVNQKENARRLVQGAIADCRSSGLAGAEAEHVVRINGFESGMLHNDLEAVFAGGNGIAGLPHAIMLPKCDSIEQLLELDIALSFYRREPNPFIPIQLFVIIESPIGLINLKQVCSFGTLSTKHSILSALVFGSDDFLARLGGTRTKNAYELLYTRQNLVTHAKAFGLDAIDLVDNDFKDLECLKSQSEEGARMGYTGKQVIHPNQVPVVQRAFSPSRSQTEWAAGLIEAFNQHQLTGKGAFVFEGHMIDKPLLLQAENIVKLQEAINFSKLS